MSEMLTTLYPTCKDGIKVQRKKVVTSLPTLCHSCGYIRAVEAALMQTSEHAPPRGETAGHGVGDHGRRSATIQNSGHHTE